MAINYNDPYNQGIGTPDLGNMNLGNMNVGNVGQVPVNNMQTAGWLPTFLGGTTAAEDAQNAALEQIREIRKNQFEGYPSGTNPAWVEEYKTNYPDLYKEYQNKQKQIQDLKKQFPQNIDIQQASLDDDEYDFSDIEGQTAFNPFSIGTGLYGMIKAGLSKKQIAKVLIKNKVQKEIGKKIKPVITGVLTGGEAKGAPGGGYTGPITHDFDPKQDTGRRPDKPGGFLDPGKGSYGPHMAYGGRVSYFDGGLLSLWPR